MEQHIIRRKDCAGPDASISLSRTVVLFHPIAILIKKTKEKGYEGKSAMAAAEIACIGNRHPVCSSASSAKNRAAGRNERSLYEKI